MKKIKLQLKIVKDELTYINNYMKNYKDKAKKYYVYCLLDEAGAPFYIGKGSKHRYKHHFAERNLKKETPKVLKIKEIYSLTKEWPVVKIYKTNLNAAEAFNLEKELIKKYGRKDKCTGILLNQTNGGGREAGWIMPDSVKKAISERMKGRKRNVTWGDALSKALKGRKFTTEHRAKLREANLKRVKEGKHIFTSKFASKNALKRIQVGSHHFLKSNFNKRPFKLKCSDGRKWKYASKVDAVKDGFTASIIDKLKIQKTFIYQKNTNKKKKIQFKPGDVIHFIDLQS
jgi:hypothetical protein